MTNEEILTLKPKADKIMSIHGNTKGDSFKTDATYITEKEGREGLEKLESTLALLGYPFKYSEVRGVDWYPEAQAVLGILTAKNIFSWSDEDLYQMGFEAPVMSLVIKTIVRFVSLKTTFDQSPTIWKKHYDFGALEVVKLDEGAKYVQFRVTGYEFFNYMDQYFDGYFARIMQLIGVNSVESIKGSWCDDAESSHTCRLYEVHWT